MTNSANERRSTSDVERERALLRDLVPATLLLIALQLSLQLADPDGVPRPVGVLWWLLPVLPALWIMRGQLRSLHRADERQRRTQLEALAVGFAATLFLAFVGGLLDAAQVGTPQQWLQLTFIGGVLSWLVALSVATRRAR